jgi:transketolase
MRKQFIKSLQHILHNDTKSVLILGDIGVFGFRNELQDIPDRTYNIGILEQATVSLAAGLAKTGLTPFVHTIAPFMIERAYEQLKIDFGYQKLGGNFISVGASYDYAALGCTHHCPADVSLISNIPNFQIVVPGTSLEFDKLLSSSYTNRSPTYYRLSEYKNSAEQAVEFGKGVLIKKGALATVICIGNMLDEVMAACKDLDVTLLYYTTIIPFDIELLKSNFNKKIVICEPFFEGSINHLITSEIIDMPYNLYNIGIPRKFLTNYGTKKEHDEHLKLTSIHINDKLKRCIN